MTYEYINQEIDEIVSIDENNMADNYSNYKLKKLCNMIKELNERINIVENL